MLESVIYISAINAFILKLLSKYGMFYNDAKYFKDFTLEVFSKMTTFHKWLSKFLVCVPCRFFFFFSIWQTWILTYFYGWHDKYFGLPFFIAVLSSFFFRIINPNYEEN